MTSGTVIDTKDHPNGKVVWIGVSDRITDEKSEIYVEKCVKARCVSPDDTVRWDDEVVYWTPRCAGRDQALVDLELVKVNIPSPVKLEAALA